MRSTFRILFYMNTSKRKKSGLCPVMGRITVDGQIAQFSMKEDARPEKWDAQKGRATGKSRQQTDLNRKITQTEQSIRDIYKRKVEESGYVTSELIKNELTGVTGKSETLLKLFQEHNAECEKRLGIDRRPSTISNYKNSYNHLSNFIRAKYSLEDYLLKQLDMSFIEQFDLYLRADVGLCSNSVVNHKERLTNA